MLLTSLLIVSCAATAAFLAWLFILLQPARPWDFQPVGDAEPIQNPQSEIRNGEWPAVRVLVPARNESAALPRTLPALLTQDYPGPYEVVVIDDRSSDGTAAVAQACAAELNCPQRLRLVAGGPLPEGWVGKVWALQQGIRSVEREACGVEREASTIHDPRDNAFFLLTDADILHAPSSLRRLVAESLAGGRALNSRMARLRCESPAERLLIPAFVFFFNLLYPMRRVNNPQDPAAAAAGGCMLLSRTALERIGGGFECIRAESIDDVNLARQVKKAGLPLHLSLSRTEVLSLRAYPRLGDIWKMVRRSAFTELKHSWLRLAGALAGLGLLFGVPVLACCAGLAGIALSRSSVELLAPGLWAALKGLLSLAAMWYVYRPAVDFFQLPRRYACTLPLAGVLYGLMTLDSALRHARGAEAQWRENEQQ